MGQGEVIKVLQNNLGKWMTAKDISEIIGTSRGCVSALLRKIYKREAGTYNLCRRDNKKDRFGYQWTIYKI